MEKKWAVVNFLKENCVEAVPFTWVNEESSECFWPPKHVKIKDAIKKQQTPQEDWATHLVSLMGTYDNLEKASRKARRAIETDNLSSYDDEYVPRKIKKPSRYETSSGESNEESESEFPNPPNHIDRELKKSETGLAKSTNSLSNYKHFTKATVKNYSECKNKTSSSKCNEISDSQGSRSTASIRSYCSDVPQPLDHTAKQKYQSSLAKFNEVYDSGNSRCATPLSSISNSSLNPDREFQRQVLRQLYIIQNKLTEHSENFQYLMKSSTNVTLTPDKVSEDIIVPHMPLENLENLNEMENFIETSNDNANRLVQELSQIGGSTPKEITKRIMYRLMSNSLGSNYSWEGAKGKLKFKKLRIANVIIRAVRSNKRTACAADDEIIDCIKSWLVRAKERDSIAKKRMNKPDGTDN